MSGNSKKNDAEVGGDSSGVESSTSQPVGQSPTVAAETVKTAANRSIGRYLPPNHFTLLLMAAVESGKKVHIICDDDSDSD
jgi:hypothetical protein